MISIFVVLKNSKPLIQELNNCYKNIFELELIQEIQEIGIQRKVKSGEKLIEVGDYIKFMPLLLSGAIKVLREDEDGDELLLYYLEKGEICSTTLICAISDKQSEIRAIAQVDTELIMIPVYKMEQWSGKYKTWRKFVFNSFNARIDELLETIDSIAFKKMDERLLDYLSEKNRVTKMRKLNITHQEIAYEMHTSRVVISRLLKKLEQSGNVKLHRNYIEIITL